MSGRDDDSEFRRAIAGVKPMKGGRLRPEPEPRLDPRTREGEPVRFEIERVGERIEGRAPDTDRRQVLRLRRGEVDPDRELDLHGLDAPTAERAVRLALSEALSAGERCLLLIHGRGHRSEGEPVLKEALPGWLAARPHGPHILAFASPDRGRGGPGAIYVLLRRKR